MQAPVTVCGYMHMEKCIIATTVFCSYEEKEYQGGEVSCGPHTEVMVIDVRWCLCRRCRRLRDKFKTVGRLLEAEEYEQLLTSIKSEWL